MNPKLKKVILSSLTLLIIFGIFSLYNGGVSNIEWGRSVNLENPKNMKENCKIEKVSYTVRGASMGPLINDGTEVSALDNYYSCGGEVEHGDVIVFEDSATKGPYIKQVRAIPGDTIVLNSDSTLSINGEVMKNSQGEIYHFSKKELNFLSLYIRDGRLQGGAYYVFGESLTNSIDSRKIGAVNKDSFRAKVILK